MSVAAMLLLIVGKVITILSLLLFIMRNRVVLLHPVQSNGFIRLSGVGYWDPKSECVTQAECP